MRHYYFLLFLLFASAGNALMVYVRWKGRHTGGFRPSAVQTVAVVFCYVVAVVCVYAHVLVNYPEVFGG